MRNIGELIRGVNENNEALAIFFVTAYDACMDARSIMRETRGRKPDLVRRAAIMLAYERERSLRKVAKLFNISHARVSKIVQAAKRGAEH